MAKFKIGNDVILNIGGLLLSLVPELCKVFGKKRGGGDYEYIQDAGYSALTALSVLTPLAVIKPDEIRKVAKFFEKLGGKPAGVDGRGIAHYEGGTFSLIAESFKQFKGNGAAGKAADFHLDQVVTAALSAAGAIGVLASELYTVADKWGQP